MRTARFAWPAALASTIALAAPAIAHANEVTKWNQIAANTLVAFPPPGGGAPPALQVNMAMTQGAVYDAVNSIQRRHRPYLLMRMSNPMASKEAAVATAAHAVLANLVATEPFPFAARASLAAMLDTEYTNSLSAIPDSPFKTAGIAAGNAAAEAMLADRANDGRFTASPWVPDYSVGHWLPLIDPVTGLPSMDPTPWVANVRPFLLNSADQFRTAGPNDLSSEAYARDFNEVKRLGSATSTERTPEQTQIALFWQSTGGPAILWNRVARDLVENPAYHVDLVDSAFLFGMLNLTTADAAISCWYEKYFWDFWRPWHAIHEADHDRNEATEAESSWAPLLTAPYPEHPSGHLSLDGAALSDLQMFFGDDIAFDVWSSRSPTPRHYTSFSEALNQIVEARIWAGLHFRTADVQAVKLGEDIAHYAQLHYFQPIH